MQPQIKWCTQGSSNQAHIVYILSWPYKLSGRSFTMWIGSWVWTVAHAQSLVNQSCYWWATGCPLPKHFSSYYYAKCNGEFFSL